MPQQLREIHGVDYVDSHGKDRGARRTGAQPVHDGYAGTNRPETIESYALCD